MICDKPLSLLHHTFLGINSPLTNTMFAYRPPMLPDDDELWDIFEQGHQLLIEAGYQQYETSAYAKPGFQCQHNLNYWRFGDYLAIGCGAHGKLTFPNGDILRFS